MTLTLDMPWALFLLVLVGIAYVLQRPPAGQRPRLSPPRDRAVRILRPLIVTLLVLALAGLTAARRADRLTTIFAVDASRSVGGANHPEVVRWLTEATNRLQGDDRVGVVVFGQNAMVETFPTTGFRGVEILGRPDDGGSHLEAALRLAQGLFAPADEARLVFLTDGLETHGSIAQAVASVPDDLDLVWLPIPSTAAAEVLVEQVSVPQTITEGEPHLVRVVLRTNTPVVASLRLYRGATPVASTRVTLDADQPQVLTFEQTAPPGSRALLYRAVVESAGDATPENNRASALVEVDGAASVLLVDHQPNAIAPLAQALRNAGMEVNVGGAGALPAGVQGLSAYDAVILSDVAAKRFSGVQLQALRTWVEDLGGGLVMIGGPEGFGRGGYWKTPVEDVLPLSMEVKDQTYFPSVGLILAIDKSGSMAGANPALTGIADKMEMAKAAAAEVVRLLEPMDQLGIIAFDFEAKWIVEMTSSDQADAILGRLGELRAGGGTDAYPAMNLALEALKPSQTRVKHLILVTDGQLQARNHEGLARDMLAEDITVSTVGIGSDADIFTLAQIADNGGGAFYHAEDVSQLPQIFLRDAFRAARSWVVEETFEPQVLRSHPLLAAIGNTSFPPLDGYVAASEKPPGDHLLTTHLEDPLLSVWRVGLGQAAAFTADAKARWASRWLNWPGYEPFWASVTRYVLGGQSSNRLRLAAEASGGRLRISADVLDNQGAFVNGAALRTRIVGPDGQTQEISLRQEGPGRYAAETEATLEGPYLAAVIREEDGRLDGATTSAIVPYADEFRGLTHAPEALERLVSAGRVRQLTDPEELLQHLGRGGWIRWPLWPWLLALAATLLVVEVAFRKLAFPERQRIPVEVTTDPRLAALRAARSRVPAPTAVRQEGVPETLRPSPTPPVATQVSTQTSTAPRSETKQEKKEAPKTDSAESPRYTSRLLAAKRRSKNPRR